MNKQREAEEAISKIENSRLLTGELIRLGYAMGKGKQIASVEDRIDHHKLPKVVVTMTDGIKFFFC